MKKDWESLWDVEQREKENKKRLDVIRNAVGRDVDLPTQLKSRKIGVRGVENPENILRELGYTKFFDRGFIKKIDPTHRYHANVSLDKKHIYIHIDIGKKRHKATKDGVQPEIDKISRIVQRIVSEQEIKRGDKPKHFKPTYLSEAQKKIALEKLWEENHPIKAFFKKVIHSSLFTFYLHL